MTNKFSESYTLNNSKNLLLLFVLDMEPGANHKN